MKGQTFFSKLDKDKRYILTCCFFVFAVNGLYAMILGSLLPLISSEYGLSNTVSGTLLSAHQIGTLIAGFIAGILPVYLGRKKSIIFLCCFVVMGFLIMIFTGNPVLLFLGFLFTGLSRGSISNFNNTLVNEVSGSSSAALSFLHSIFAIGALLAPFLVIFSTNMAGDSGWRISAVVIVTLAFISIFLFSRMKIEENVVKKEKGKASYGFLKNTYFWLCAGIFFFYLCAESTINGFMVKYFVDEQIMTREYAQVLASVLWAVILVGRLTCAFIGDRIPKKYLLMVMGIGTFLFYILLLSTQNVTLITISIIGLGFFMSAIYSTTISSVGGTISSYPMAMGVLLLLGGLGSIMMPTVTGALADAFGIFAGMSAIVVAIVLMLFCIFINAFRKQEV